MSYEAPEQIVNNAFKSKVKLRIEFYFKQFGKYKDHEHIVQGEKFTWGIKITNNGNTKSQKGIITSAYLTNSAQNYCRYGGNFPIVVRELEPSEYINIEFETTSIYVEGMCWAVVYIEPNDNGYEYETYQLNTPTGVEDRYSSRSAEQDTYNIWRNTFFVQKKMELIQAKTNTLILWLTIITVVESLFGIKSTLLFFIQFFIKLYKLAIWFLTSLTHFIF